MSSTDGVHVKLRRPLLYIDGVSAKSPSGIEYEKEGCYERIRKVRERLAILIAALPKDLMTKADKDESTVPQWIEDNIDEIEENILEDAKKLGVLELYESILDDWENDYPGANSWEAVEKPVDFGSSESRSIVFPEDTHVNDGDKAKVALGLKSFEFESIEDLFNASIENITANKSMSDSLAKLVYVKYRKQLFTTYTGQWLFSSKDEAMKAVKDRLSMPVWECMHGKQTSTTKKFISSLAEMLDKSAQAKVVELLEDENSYKMLTSQYRDLYEMMAKAFEKFIVSKFSFVELGCGIEVD